MNIENISPNKIQKISLNIAGEIRFGPYYYNLKINDFCLGIRIFGSDFLWSDDSRYLAIQEWRTADYKDGPLTELVLFDLIMKKEHFVSFAKKGFIVPISFQKNLLIYKKEYKGVGFAKEFEIDFLALKDWKDIEIIKPCLES